MKKFYQYVHKNDKKYYSLNFLLSENLTGTSNKPKRTNKIVKKAKSVDLLHNNYDQRNYYFYNRLLSRLGKPQSGHHILL